MTLIETGDRTIGNYARKYTASGQTAGNTKRENRLWETLGDIEKSRDCTEYTLWSTPRGIFTADDSRTSGEATNGQGRDRIYDFWLDGVAADFE